MQEKREAHHARQIKKVESNRAKDQIEGDVSRLLMSSSFCQYSCQFPFLMGYGTVI